MTSIDQSVIDNNIWYVRLNGTTITTDTESIKKLLRSGMSTVIGKAMLDDYIKRLNRK